MYEIALFDCPKCESTFERPVFQASMCPHCDLLLRRKPHKKDGCRLRYEVGDQLLWKTGHVTESVLLLSDEDQRRDGLVLVQTIDDGRILLIDPEQLR